MMNDNEIELLRMIRDRDNPEQALKMAVEVILGFLAEKDTEIGAVVKPGFYNSSNEIRPSDE